MVAGTRAVENRPDIVMHRDLYLDLDLDTTLTSEFGFILIRSRTAGVHLLACSSINSRESQGTVTTFSTDNSVLNSRDYQTDRVRQHVCMYVCMHVCIRGKVGWDTLRIFPAW